jgi:hypothetical protein
MCNACGWAWPTQRVVPARSSPDQALRDDFNAHDCSTFSLTTAEEHQVFPNEASLTLVGRETYPLEEEEQL